MARVKGGTVTRARRKRILKQAEGYFGAKHLLFKTAYAMRISPVALSREISASFGSVVSTAPAA